jgi:O-antigen ligase
MGSGVFHIPRRQTPEQIESLFAAQRTGDRLGLGIHLALAIGACFMAGWPTSFVEFAALPLLVCFLIRMTGWHRMLEPLAFDRLMRLLLAWGAWVCLSLIWTVGRGKQEHGSAPAWLMDVRDLRFLALAVVIWPVLDRRTWLIAAVMAGIAFGQVSQLVHLTGVIGGWPSVTFGRAAGRISGWWDPVSGGTVLCAGLGLWLAPALWGPRARMRLWGTLGVLATLGCIALTGTRGAWVGAAALVPVAIVVRLVHRRARRQALWPFGIAMACVAILAYGAAWFALHHRHAADEIGIQQRFQRGIQEVRNGFGPEGWRTDTGMRIAMWQWALAEWRTHPILGVGAGGFQPWVRVRTPADAERLGAPAGAIPGVHAQAHSTYFHTLATLGSVGFVLLIGVLGTAVVSGLRRSGDEHPSVVAESLAMGPALAILGLACAGLFDTITVNQQPSYLLYLLAAMCLPSRPREASAAAAPAHSVRGVGSARSGGGAA